MYLVVYGLQFIGLSTKMRANVRNNSQFFFLNYYFLCTFAQNYNEKGH